jgi:PKD repeat protein
MEGRLLIGAIAVGLVTGNVAFAATALADSHGDETLEFGMGPNSIEPQKAAGVAPDYQTVWVGPWNLDAGWGGTNDQLEYMQSEGVTPAVHLYYWGDDISPTCVEEGCWSDIHDTQKDKQGWQQLTQELVDNLWATMDGDRVVVLLETEFNKGGIEDYEPFDTYLTEKIDFIHEHYPAAEVVVPFGNWGRSQWGNFDQAAAAGDHVGLQGMRGSTQDSWDSYHYLYEDTLQGTQYLQDLFGESIILHDMALSSYPEPDYLEPQANELSEVFDNRGELKANGVEAMIYRSWFNNPNMDTSNYYGEAERHWGFAYADTEEHKPAAQVWIDGVQAERGPEATHGTDVGSALTYEAESFETKTTGGQVSDGAAANGEAWNIWSDGSIEHPFNFTQSTYEIGIDARGTPAEGTQAHMLVTLDGDTLVDTYVTEDYRTYTAEVAPSDVQDLRVQFTNDLMTDTEDRNLIVDRVTLTETGNRAPTANISATTDGPTVHLDGTNSRDPDGDQLEYLWFFGDQNSTRGPTVNHTYDDPGDYEITLTVDDGNQTDREWNGITVEENNRAPTASFETATSGSTATFDASGSSDPNDDPLTYAWELGDGTTATGEVVEHEYATEGDYEVNLTVTDDDGVDDETSRTVSVSPDPGSEMHVHSINHWSTGPHANAEVVVYDGNEDPVADATVDVETCKDSGECLTWTAQTDGSGADDVKWKKAGGGTFTTCANDVRHASLDYEASADHARDANCETRTI